MRLLLAGLAALAACGGAPEPQPFRGPAPTSIAVLPVRGADLPLALLQALDASAHQALAERGYAVVAAALVGPTLDPGVPLEVEVLRGIRRDFGADAVLERTGRLLPGRVAGDGEPFAVRWTLLSTDDGSVLWTREEQGGPGRVVSRHVVGPQGRYEPDPFFTDEPIVGRGNQDWVTEERAKDVVDQAWLVQRALAARLPAARPE